MKLIAVILSILACLASGAAQSGRTKPSPTPTPKKIAGPSVIYMPTEPSTGPIIVTDIASPPSHGDIIKVSSVLVPIPVSVLDASGRSISTLKLDDFQLAIDGNAVEIGELSRSEAPIRLAMLFDNSSSVRIAREFEKNAAVRFFRRVVRPEKDMAALFSVADYTRLEQPLTNDIGRLTNAIENFSEPKGATALLDGIIEAAVYLKSASGRRVLVIMSDGEDTYSELATTLERVIRTLLTNDVQVYVVGTKDFENFKRTGIRGGNANIRALTAERRMIEIAAQTGGAVFSPIDEAEMKDAFDRISAELSQQYVLSYYPEDDAAKRGEFRSIALSIKNKPSLTPRTRKGYYVPKK